MRRRRLAQFGCSWSDYTETDSDPVNATYGEILAKHYDAEYIHEARGCGSNARYFRILPRMVHDGILSTEDIIIIQIIAWERTEVWSGRKYPIIDYRSGFNMTDPWFTHKKRNGTILRMKSEAWEWFDYPEEREYAKQWLLFQDPSFELEVWNSHMLSLQGYLDAKGFKNVFWIYPFSGPNVPEHKRKNTLVYPQDMMIPRNFIGMLGWANDEMTLKTPDGEPHDYCHLSQAGHEHVAQKIIDEIGSI